MASQVYYTVNQIDKSCHKEATNLDVTDGKDAAFAMNCSVDDVSEHISIKDIDKYATELIDLYTKFNNIWTNGMQGNKMGYKALIAQGNPTADGLAYNIIIEGALYKDKLEKKVSNIRDKLYTQSCQMWNTSPKSAALLCNIDLMNKHASNRNQQKLASLELIDNNTKLYNETLIKIYLALLVDGVMFYLIYKTLT